MGRLLTLLRKRRAADPLAALLAALGAKAVAVFTDPANTATASSWEDQTGTGDLSGGGSGVTIETADGRAWVKFDATAGTLSRAGLGVGPDFDLFARCRYDTPGGVDFPAVCTFGGAVNDWGVGVHEAGGEIRAIRNEINASANAAPLFAESTTGVIHVAGSGNTTWAAAWAGLIGLDAEASEAASLGYAEGDGLALGPNQNGSTANLYVADLILCDPLTAGERAAVFDYLALT